MRATKSNVFNASFYYSLLLFLALSMILLTSYIPIYGFITTQIQKNILESYQHTLESSTAVLDTSLKALGNAISSTYSDKQFRILKYETIPQGLNRIDFESLIDQFNSLLLAHEMIYDAMILLSDEVVLTRARCFYEDMRYAFYPDFFACEGYDYGQWKALLRSGTPIVASQVYTSTEYGRYPALTYARAWSTEQYSSAKLFVATISIGKLSDALFRDIPKDKAYLCVRDMNGKTLYEFGGENRPEVTVIRSRTSQLLLTIELGLPNAMMSENSASIRRTMYRYALVMIAATFVLIILFSIRSAQPMSKLLSTINYHLNIKTTYDEKLQSVQKTLPRIRREYAALENSLQALDRKLEDYQKRIDRQNNTLRMQIILQALHGDLTKADEWAQFQTVFPSFPARYRLAFLYYAARQNSGQEVERRAYYSIIGAFNQTFPHGHVFGLDAGVMLMILPCEGKGADGHESALHSFREILTNSFDMSVRILSSSVYARPQELILAYEQIQCLNAVSSLDQCQAEEERQPAPLQLPLSVEMLQVIHGALSGGNAGVAVHTLQKAMESLTDPTDYLLHRHTFNMISNMLVQLKLENPSVLMDVEFPPFDKEHMADIFIAQFPECFHEICRRIAQTRDVQIDDFAQEVMDYIHNNLTNPDLCINLLIDRFHISPPKLQKIVKRVTDKTFSAYVEQMRMQVAYLLLTKGEESVKSVAAKCGFSSQNSFYKVFRRFYGLSPSSIKEPD